MASSRTVFIAGAGIGGLSAALAIARQGFPVAIFEQAPRLEEIGAGIQLSPNASRILIALGLGDTLQRHVVAPDELRVMNARTGRMLASTPLGALAASRYGAPYWVIHRGDLQAVLIAAARATPNIALTLDARIEGFTLGDGVTLSARAPQALTERGLALVAADGLWSSLRARLGHGDEPRFASHVAWRALVPADTVAPDLRAPAITLWLGNNAHLVHYPVSGGSQINVVAIFRDDWREIGWSAPGARADVLARYPKGSWPPAARAILEAPRQWQKWALYDRPPNGRWGMGAVALLGDAAHPMLPYLAQGAAMAIEDAAVFARRLAETPADPASAVRRYARQRLARTARVQRAARANGRIYHLGGRTAWLRTLALGAFSGKRLLSHYDWLYGWTPT